MAKLDNNKMAAFLLKNLREMGNHLYSTDRNYSWNRTYVKVKSKNTFFQNQKPKNELNDEINYTTNVQNRSNSIQSSHQAINTILSEADEISEIGAQFRSWTRKYQK